MSIGQSINGGSLEITSTVPLKAFVSFVEIHGKNRLKL